MSEFKSIFLKSTILIPFFFVTACGDSEKIESLKSHVFNYIDNSISLGNALSSRKMCSSTKWEEFKDDRNRDAVRYKCDLTNYSDIFEGFVDSDLNFYRTKISTNIENNNKLISLYNERITQLDNLTSAINKIKSKNIDKEYNNISTELGYDTHNYDFLFDDSRGYIVNEYRDKDLQAKLVTLEDEIRNIVVQSGVKKEFYYDLGLSRSYTDNIDYLKISDSDLNDIFKSKLKNYNDAIDEAEKNIKTQEDFLKEREEALSTVRNKMLPKNISQTVVFSTDNKEPTPTQCTFKFTFKGEKDIDFTPDGCFSMSYESEYNQSYIDMFHMIFRKFISN
ncbi:hypothetical protein NRC09_003257 [Salmonella enterica]|nr:hypothetical protein [Salmonella enterica]